MISVSLLARYIIDRQSAGGAGLQMRLCSRLRKVYIRGLRGGRRLFILLWSMPTSVNVVGRASTGGGLMMGLDRVVFTYGQPGKWIAY